VKSACLCILRTGSFVRNASYTVLRWLVPLSHVDILALRKFLVPKMKEVTVVKNIYELYSSSDIFRMIRSIRRGRWAAHVARMGQREMPTGIW
jgi:hypothetical protein